MNLAEHQQWKSLAPLLYSYLFSIEVKDFKNLTAAKFSQRNIKSSSFKFQEYRTIMTGKDQANNGLLTINQLMIPLTKDLDDNRLKCKLNRLCTIQFESQVTILQQCLIKSSSLANEESAGDSFLTICEKKHSQILVYPIQSLEQVKDKSQPIHPRLRLIGHQSQITVIKNRGQEILSGNKKGEIMIHNLRSGENQSHSCFRYHRQSVVDCCWIASNNSNVADSGIFASCSTDSMVYLWDKRNNLPVNKIATKQGDVNCLENLSQNCFITGGQDGTIKLWDLRANINKFYCYKQGGGSIKKLLKMKGQKTQNNNHFSFASGSKNGQILIWEQQAQFCHLSHQNQIKDISYDLNSQTLISIDTGHPTICIWKPAIYSDD